MLHAQAADRCGPHGALARRAGRTRGRGGVGRLDQRVVDEALVAARDGQRQHAVALPDGAAHACQDAAQRTL